ncbi:MAG: hypothetical protein CVT77_10960 [Alphaproteobacteria bacterium HGW-Alphaproteobacteria-16]|nr:MAG: hypothetical protein CVT77_10960 [Alphaproteobacteria bacterium HGW-Alphaproteobacteria-16]
MRQLIPLLALPLLAACVGADSGYPSLLPREIEGRDMAEPVRPDPVATPDAELDSQIAAQRTAAAEIARSFQAAAIDAETRVAIARGVAPGSESWIAAHTALSELDVIRGDMVGVVTVLEELAISRAQEGAVAYPALDAAITDLGAQAQAQGQRITDLETALAG